MAQEAILRASIDSTGARAGAELFEASLQAMVAAAVGANGEIRALSTTIASSLSRNLRNAAAQTDRFDNAMRRMSPAANEFLRQTGRMVAGLNRVESEAGQASAALATTATAARNIRGVGVGGAALAGGGTGGAAAAAAGGFSTRSLTTTISRMRTLVYMIGAGLGVSHIVKASAEFERLRATIERLQGTVRGQQAFTQIQKWAIETPATIDEITKAFIQLQVRGLKPTHDDMMFLSDMASTFQKDFDFVQKALAGAQRGDFRMARGFGMQAMKKGTDLTFQVGDQKAHATAGNLREIIEAWKELLGPKVLGQSERIMNTVSGSFSNLVDSIDMASDRMGRGGLNAGITDLNHSLTTFFKNSGAANDLGIAIGGIASVIARIVDLIRTLDGLVAPGSFTSILLGAAVGGGIMRSWRGAGAGMAFGAGMGIGDILGAAGNKASEKMGMTPMFPAQIDTDLIAPGVWEKAQRYAELHAAGENFGDPLGAKGPKGPKALVGTDRNMKQKALIDAILGAYGGSTVQEAAIHKMWKAQENDLEKIVKSYQEAGENARTFGKVFDEELRKIPAHSEIAVSGIQSLTGAITDLAFGAKVNFADIATQFAKMVAEMALRATVLRGILYLFPSLGGMGAGQPGGGSTAIPNAGSPLPTYQTAPALQATVINNMGGHAQVTTGQDARGGVTFTIDAAVAAVENRIMQRASRGGGVAPLLRASQHRSGGRSV